jgi:hypothetical protein
MRRTSPARKSFSTISGSRSRPGRRKLRGCGLKYELDALANKDFQYLTKKYLPRKLKEKDWLD